MATRAITGLKKRQQIAAANRAIFIWVIIASIVLSFTVVAGQFLVRTLLFNQKIISQKADTESTLDDNKQAIEELKANVDALVSDANLKSVLADPAFKATQGVIDALPTKLDNAALASSLQNKILLGSGVKIEEITFPSSEILDDPLASPGEVGVAVEQPFTLKISGTYQQVLAALTDINRSIRPMSFDKLSIKASGPNEVNLELEAKAYFQEPISIELKKEKLKP